MTAIVPGHRGLAMPEAFRVRVDGARSEDRNPSTLHKR